MQVLKQVRLEMHDSKKNAHRFYKIQLQQSAPDQFRVYAIWGRCEGYSGAGKCDSQIKDVVGDVISALVIYQDWICAKEKRRYKQIQPVTV